MPGDEFYLDAFNDLSTTRQFGMGTGPIPWDRIVQYGHMAGLDSMNMEAFIVVIRTMDNEYLRWIEENRPTSGDD